MARPLKAANRHSVGSGDVADSPQRIARRATEYSSNEIDAIASANEDAEGIHKLLYAILERTIRDATAQTYGQASKKRHKAAAIDYVLDQGINVYSFAWICEHLGADANATRARILAMVDSGQPLGLHPNSSNDFAVTKYLRETGDIVDTWDIEAIVRLTE